MVFLPTFLRAMRIMARERQCWEEHNMRLLESAMSEHSERHSNLVSLGRILKYWPRADNPQPKHCRLCIFWLNIGQWPGHTIGHKHRERCTGQKPMILPLALDLPLDLVALIERRRTELGDPAPPLETHSVAHSAAHEDI